MGAVFVRDRATAPDGGRGGRVSALGRYAAFVTKSPPFATAPAL